MIIDCVSDLHGYYPKLAGGDLLIVAGDLTARDTFIENMKILDWILQQNYLKKILIAGNHDNYLQKNASSSIDKNKTLQIEEIEYLCDSGTIIYYDDEIPLHPTKVPFKKLKIWGSPWTLKFEGMNPECEAFTVDTEKELAQKWKLIPEDTDILITHSPPFMTLDSCIEEDGKHHCVGSPSLANKINVMKDLKLHVFGHIHEHGGKIVEDIRKSVGLQKVIFVNASHVNERYQPVNKPVRINL